MSDIVDSIGKFSRMGIGEAQRLYGLTARALRFYDERGLLQARRDRNNVRYYDAVARDRLDWICALRLAGVSLPDIAEVLAADTGLGERERVALDKLSARRELVAAELAAVEALSEALLRGADAFEARALLTRSAA